MTALADAERAPVECTYAMAAFGRLLPGMTGRFGSLCAGGVWLSPAKTGR